MTSLRAVSLGPLTVTGTPACDAHPRRGVRGEVLSVLGGVFMPLGTVGTTSLPLVPHRISIGSVMFGSAPGEVFDAIVGIDPIQMTNLCSRKGFRPNPGQRDQDVNPLPGQLPVVSSDLDRAVPLMVGVTDKQMPLGVPSPGENVASTTGSVPTESWNRADCHDIHRTVRQRSKK